MFRFHSRTFAAGDRMTGGDGRPDPVEKKPARYAWRGPASSRMTDGPSHRRRRSHAVARVLHAQQRRYAARWRIFTRRGEIWLVVLAALVGVGAGLSVVALRDLAQLMHELLYDLPSEAQLSGLSALSAYPYALVPTVGGLVLGALALLLRRRKSRMVDPVEANALHGGRLSLTDSIIVVVQTLISNGFGASVGLEAAYTQIGSGLASKLATRVKLRRADMRILVGCGAAGAIAAAFGAPLTGAFYGFELIIGTYTIASLAPVICAAITAVLVSQVVGPDQTGIFVHISQAMDAPQIALLLALGLVTGGIGILIMYFVTLVGTVFDRTRVPAYLRPAVGGVALGLLALVSPKVLSSGHAAVHESFALGVIGIRTALTLLCLKALASSVSIGAGFRGGLFFASLYLGALVGQLFYGVVALASPDVLEPAVCMLVAMAGLAAAIVGGPLTMSFLALELSGSLPLTIVVLLAAVASSLLVRETFGYSFTTWRFHLRGEAIRSAQDIGWMRNLTVGRMMRKDMRTVDADLTVREFRRLYPLGSAQRVIAVERDGQYAGIVVVAELYSRTNDESEGTIREMLLHSHTVLVPAMTAKQAALRFEQSESEALAVVMGKDDWSVLGLLSEAYVLRRYAEEVDKARMQLSGERI